MVNLSSASYRSPVLDLSNTKAGNFFLKNICSSHESSHTFKTWFIRNGQVFDKNPRTIKVVNWQKSSLLRADTRARFSLAKKKKNNKPRLDPLFFGSMDDNFGLVVFKSDCEFRNAVLATKNVSFRVNQSWCFLGNRFSASKSNKKRLIGFEFIQFSSQSSIHSKCNCKVQLQKLNMKIVILVSFQQKFDFESCLSLFFLNQILTFFFSNPSGPPSVPCGRRLCLVSTSRWIDLWWLSRRLPSNRRRRVQQEGTREGTHHSQSEETQKSLERINEIACS